jgi:hypothetical protein
MFRWLSAHAALTLVVSLFAVGSADAQSLASVADDVRGDEDGQSGRFGRMFHLPPFAAPTPDIKAGLVRMGARGQVLDAQDHVAAGPVALIVDPFLSLNNRNS